ncbi:hypothetical protein [Mycobacteroides abscessus]|uniref:hypothetical protein n=1 Tax=Mycobacteroides abscessus TaxID=36809 RepID=UPI0005785358|nr:hypothetical protein [Mycobacteroides abscessus]PVA77169.1 hypothetical protein DDJ37_00240 [Mycobacteroides abscessus]PVB18632.1 hypothetical protein DDJ40_01945 [Mycobacteroides abscessus]RIU00498.1 hypothetical protein D2F00_01790 [Mycobacteroides abscessus]
MTKWTKDETLRVADWLKAQDWQRPSLAACTDLAKQLDRSIGSVRYKAAMLISARDDFTGVPLHYTKLDKEIVSGFEN